MFWFACGRNSCGDLLPLCDCSRVVESSAVSCNDVSGGVVVIVVNLVTLVLIVVLMVTALVVFVFS